MVAKNKILSVKHYIIKCPFRELFGRSCNQMIRCWPAFSLGFRLELISSSDDLSSNDAMMDQLGADRSRFNSALRSETTDDARSALATD